MFVCVSFFQMAFKMVIDIFKQEVLQMLGGVPGVL